MRETQRKKAVYAISLIALVSVIVPAALVADQLLNKTSKPPNEGVEAQTTYAVFKLAIRLEKSEFGTGEIIRMNISLVNVGEENATITFTTRPNPNPYWFWLVYNDTQQAVFVHKTVTYIPTFEEVTLKSGEFMQGIYSWDQRATDDEQVPPGTYYITAAVSFFHKQEEIYLETQIKIDIESE